MSELKLNLDLALEKVNWAIENEIDEKNKHMYIDTKAEVLWKMGRVEEAIAEIEKCISFDSEDKYYGEQLEKFQKSQNPA
jgi:tetratricopeptide (TPR) repeat protein